MRYGLCMLTCLLLFLQSCPISIILSGSGAFAVVNDVFLICKKFIKNVNDQILAVYALLMVICLFICPVAKS
jgi:hypothetical protein